MADPSIPNPGIGSANIFIQNIGDNTAAIRLDFTEGPSATGVPTFSSELSLAEKAAKMLLYTQNWGSTTSVPNGWAGSVEMSSSEPLAAIVNLFWDYGGTTWQAAGTYTGIDAPSTEIYLPNCLVRDGRQTRVYIQNTSDTAATIYLNYYDRNGNPHAVDTKTLDPKKQMTLYLNQEITPFPTAGVGSLYITSTVNLAAAASLHYPLGYIDGDAASAAYSGVSSGDTTIWIPSIFRRGQEGGPWELANASIVQNLGDATANVTVYFIGKTAAHASTSASHTIPPKASYGYNMMVQGTADANVWNAIQSLGTNWAGTIKVVSTNGQPLAGVGFYFPYKQKSGIMAYNAIRDSDATNKISAPAIYRKWPGQNWDATAAQWSTTLVQNLDETNPVNITVNFYKSDGTFAAGPYTVNIPAGGSVGLNLYAGVDLPQDALNSLDTVTNYGYSGGMIIEAPTGSRLISITNILYRGRANGAAYPCFPMP
jgi:hypothetical protein